MIVNGHMKAMKSFFGKIYLQLLSTLSSKVEVIKKIKNQRNFHLKTLLTASVISCLFIIGITVMLTSTNDQSLTEKL